MYLVLLAIHNIVRWVILIAALFVLFRAFGGWARKRAYEQDDRTGAIVFTTALDIQLLLGLILFFMAGFSNLGRFFMEHIIPMILAVILAHVGSALSKKASSDFEKHRKAAIWFSLAMLVILIAIPWMRPMWPAF